MFGNFGPTEMIFIFVVLLLLFGGKKLPEVGAGLGKGIREFKRSMNDIQNEIDQPAQQIRQATRTQVAPPQSTPVVDDTQQLEDGTRVR
jgi:sec-independent protein translocase protein TatA